MIRVLVDFGLSFGADLDPTYFVIGRSRLGEAQLAPSDTLADYTGRAMHLSVQRTCTRKVGPIIEYNGGTATVTLLNDDGLLDPATLEAAGLTAPGVVMRIRVDHEGVTYPIFRGFVDSWLPSHVYPDHATVTVTGSDAFSRLALRRRTALTAAVGASEDTGARIGRILDSIGWPAADRDIAVGDSLLAATTLDGDALDEARRAVLAEAGELYVTGDGKVRFRNRHALLTDERSAASQGTFGTDISGGELMYVGVPGLAWDREQLVNAVTAAVAGGVEQTATDSASVDRYGLYSHSETDLVLRTDADAAAWARHVLHQTRLPTFRVTSLQLDTRLHVTPPVVTTPDPLWDSPHILWDDPDIAWDSALTGITSTDPLWDSSTVLWDDPDMAWDGAPDGRTPSSAGLIPQALGREIGDRITVVRRPPGGLVDSREVFVRGISHAWSGADRWITDWELQPASTLSYFVIGRSAIGADAIAY